jgi:hypothetical protein
VAIASWAATAELLKIRSAGGEDGRPAVDREPISDLIVPTEPQ